MPYPSLHHLVAESSSARRYFFSLPPQLQSLLRAQSQQIHSAAQLHQQAEVLEKHQQALANSQYFDGFWQK